MFKIKKQTKLILLTFALLSLISIFSFKTTLATQYNGDGTYNLTNGDRVVLNNGAIIEPIYGESSCLVTSPCFSVKIYRSTGTYLSQWWAGTTGSIPKEINTDGYRFTITINSANINNTSWTASMNFTSISEEQCISFTYSDWSSCTNGQKTRTLISSYPSGCTGGNPYLTSSCFNDPTHIGDGTYTIHEFETIRLNNGAILEPVFDRPINVYFISFKVYDDEHNYADHLEQIGSIYPIRVGTTEPIDTTIGSNYRIRVVLNSLDFNNDTWTASVTFTSLYEPQCTSFTYSEWSYCYNNVQWRSILTSSPANCIAGNAITTQSCVSPQYNGDGTYTVRSGERIHLNNGAYISPGYVQNSQTGNEVILDVLNNNQIPLGMAAQIMVNDPPKDFTVGAYQFRASATSAGMQNGVWTTTLTLLSLNNEESVACTSFTYENWSECSDGWKLRRIISKSPENCVDVNGIAITRQACESNNTTNIQTQQNETNQNTTTEQTNNTTINTTLSTRLKGQLLLSVENRGRIWYVNPTDLKKYEVTFANALPLFEKLSLGITNANLNQISETKVTTLGNTLKGKLLLAVEDHGRIWYIDMNGLKHEVTWANLMDLFRRLSLGITNENLDKIESETVQEISTTTDSDNDGLSDVDEAKYKTDPNNPDTDGDGYKDGEEVQGGYDPLKGDGAKF